MTKILIAENNQATLEFLSTALKRAGNLVETTDNSLDAWRATSHSYYDVMIVNIMMPGIDGFILAQKALQDNPDIQIIFVTGFAAVAMDTYATPTYAPAPMTSRPFHLRDIVSRVRYLMGETDLPMQAGFGFGTAATAAHVNNDNVIYAQFGAAKA